MKALETDIIVVGAGLVGLSASVAFAQQGKNVVLVDAKPVNTEKSQDWDARIYALSQETEVWLKTLDAWRNLDAGRVCAIDAMHLWSDSEEELVLRSSDANLVKLGVILENQNLMVALWQQVNALGVTVITDAACASLENTQHEITLTLENKTKIAAKLIVAADGANSWVRSQANIAVKQKDFQQTAIVTNFATEKANQNIAQQWFAPHETLALLPLVGKNVSLVWSLSTAKAEELLKLSVGDFAAQVAEKSKHTLGDLQAIGKTLSFGLCQQTAASLIAARVVLVGDAAHQIHPMAGQGVNLGFRDVMQLTSLTAKLNAMQDVGEYGFLRKYERARVADITAMNSLTTGLDYLFASESGLVNNVTNWGLRQLNRQSVLKKLLIKQAA